ncbi:terminase small subunit [Ochrobactrum chromiisoli]|uniref:Terminase small subunit n=1 Tax=Ochrobactrum chromiisoli TaxID=2993941 RepID=A0ABT3QKU0_9HYPH|nr:terminase small subunit [Ochrobactrum chromiisoli]MCX2696233.1 terminase small subunit [Ochrobactrum chromiisoli]
MARKKVTNTVLKSADENAEAFSTDDTFRNISASSRAAIKNRIVSLQELSTLLHRDRNTISAWLKHGLPYVEAADKNIGKAWSFDTAEVVRWLEKRAADSAVEKLGVLGSDGKTSEEEAKRRRAVAAAIITELEAAEAVKTVVRVSHVVDRISADYSEIRSRLMSLPDAISGRVETKVAQKVREIADEQVRSALKALRVDRDFHQAEG